MKIFLKNLNKNEQERSDTITDYGESNKNNINCSNRSSGGNYRT